MTHGSLFSGIGGFDLAAEWMGWENKFHCEWNEFGQKLLKHYWPKAKSYEDIKETDFTIWRNKINILTGGFPCQPYSSAGKRLGKEDDRHLWPEMLRAIQEIQPDWVVGENVLGIVNWNGGLVFDEVQADLEAEGYEVQPYVLPAVSVNAPHRRDRVWFVAFNTNSTTSGKERNLGRKDGSGISGASEKGVFQETHNKCFGFGEVPPEERITSNTSKAGLERGASERIQKNERGERKSRELCLAARYSRCDWEKFPTQSPICGGNDGLPTELDGITFPKWRNESIKAYGNAIVPQVALQIFKAIQEYKNKTLKKF